MLGTCMCIYVAPVIGVKLKYRIVNYSEYTTHLLFINKKKKKKKKKY